MADDRNPKSLATVVKLVKDWVEKCGWVWVEAQIIELRRRAGYTQFLTLHDLTAEVSAKVRCSKIVLDSAGQITEGMTVLAHLHPTVYEKDGSLSFECNNLEVVGEGKLFAELEKLKRKLYAEGLFDPRKKKPLPYLPQNIGLITGANSAAERDVKTNILLRWPAAIISTRYAQVQGVNAVRDVMDALAELDSDDSVDVIIIARGGGSLEDLLPFSNEGLVRAVHQAKTPVISAIGHEPDSPLLDYVADLRASTPTDAAKRVVPDQREELSNIGLQLQRLRQAMAAILTVAENQLTQLLSRPVLSNPVTSIQLHESQLDRLLERLNQTITVKLDYAEADLRHGLEKIRALSPQATLNRGYSILFDNSNQPVTFQQQTKPGDDLTAQLANGSLHVKVIANND